MAEERTEFVSSDPESQKAKSEYQAMIESIERRIDPDSNTVLVVDDEVGIRKYVSRSIRKSTPGVVVYEAGNGQEALEKLEEIRLKYKRDPVFIVMDLNMPVMDGWKLIDRLYEDYTEKGHPMGIPVIVLSSTSGEKGLSFFRKTVHGRNVKYQPLVAVAKEVCADPTRYAVQGEKGLSAWIKYFSQYAE